MKRLIAEYHPLPHERVTAMFVYMDDDGTPSLVVDTFDVISEVEMTIGVAHERTH